jgi:hypothetical protein
MSAFGTKRTFLIASAMSAFGGEGDIPLTSFDAVRDRDNGDRVIDVTAWHATKTAGSVPLPLNCDLTDDHDNSLQWTIEF